MCAYLCVNINWTFHITQKCDGKAAICHYGTYTIRQRYLILSPKMPFDATLHVTLFSAIVTLVYKVYKLSFNTFFKSHMDVIYDAFPIKVFLSHWLRTFFPSHFHSLVVRKTDTKGIIFMRIFHFQIVCGKNGKNMWISTRECRMRITNQKNIECKW